MSSSKGYESRAVQTTFSPPCSPCPVVSLRPSSVDGGPQSEISTSTVESSLETPDNPSQNSDGSLVSYLSTPDRSISTSRRILKTRLPPNFPSRVIHTISQRIISLPETAPLVSVKSQISSQQRIVTMPEDIRSQRLEKEFVLYPPEYEDSPVETSNSFSMSDGNSSFAHADAVGTDISHSSSSPSSPDSVVIIQNKYRISQAFLRQTGVQTKANTNEDWTTWASSPPRPIPALHGPSSLPYARCPSGAEGTIIEEQDNLSRMIWGLDQDTAKPDGASSEPSHRTSEKNSASGATRNVLGVVVSQNPPVTTSTESTRTAGEQKIYHPNFVDPIDLGPMLAPHTQEHAHRLPRIDATDAAPTGVTDVPFQQNAHHGRYSNRRQELGVGLRPLPRRHETLKNAKPLVSTQAIVGSSLPIIILESQPQSISVPTKRRQSAIEIAQQYRKNQGLFQPVAQSQWSSGSSYSPALQAIDLPTLSIDVPESFLPNQTRVHDHSANVVHLTPSAAIDSQAISAYGINPATGLSRVHKALASPGSDLGSCPRPPPNTPLNALVKSRTANVPLQINYLPMSPDSPSATIRSLQRTKVAPMTRLAQRRLSAVLEASEDQNASVGIRPLSPPPFQQNFRLSRPLIPDGTAHSSSYAAPTKNRQNYKYQPEDVSNANATLLPEDFAQLTVEPFAPSWIRSHGQPGGSLVNGRHEVAKADSRPFQRGYKTNKTVPPGKAKGPGPKVQPRGQTLGRKNHSKKRAANGMVVIAG